MKRIMKVSCGYVGCNWEEDISDWFTEKDMKDMGKGTLDKRFEDDVLGAALEMASFEWYVEEVDEDYEV